MRSIHNPSARIKSHLSAGRDVERENRVLDPFEAAFAEPARLFLPASAAVKVSRSPLFFVFWGFLELFSHIPNFSERGHVRGRFGCAIHHLLPQIVSFVRGMLAAPSSARSTQFISPT